MKPIIEITGLSKKYPIVHDKLPYSTLRDSIMNFIKHPFTSNKTRESFWALKDINLTINKGDIIGIIGKNGAGKSTLLKILSGITKPTEGKVKLYGRVSSLLEVGTGFHPELTGRENIYLNGVILGMTRKEVSKKFDEIVTFAGIEKFLDTPVKHYSSGMYVRLAFAVAAHLEPDILIVDEVLAVGDIEFQKKCLGKMESVSKEEGRTVIFVSHNMGAISTLTNKCILLENGKIKIQGGTSEVISNYLNNSRNSTSKYIGKEDKYRPTIKLIQVITSKENNIHEYGEPLTFRFIIDTPIPLDGAAISFQIINQREIPVTHILTLDSEIPMCRRQGIYEISCIIPRPHLYPDRYYVRAYFAEKSTGRHFETIEPVCYFDIINSKNNRDYYWYHDHATYVEDVTWNIKN